jgi:esterase
MLHYRVAGEGPPVIMTHGLFGSLENLGGIAKLLATDFTVYSLDLPNHGRSPHFQGAGLTLMTQLVAQWFEQQKLTSAFWLGHSLGGKIAMELALTHEKYVDRLAIIDIAPIHYSARHEQVFAGLNAVKNIAPTTRIQADDILKDFISDVAVRTFLLKNLIKDGNNFHWRMNLADLEKQYLRLVQENQDSSFHGPTLFLKGQNSDYIQWDQKDRILKKFPNAQAKIIADTGHWLHAEKPELTASTIKRFFLKE